MQASAIAKSVSFVDIFISIPFEHQESANLFRLSSYHFQGQHKGMHSFPRERHFTEYVRPAVEATMGKGRISHEWRSWSVVLNGDDSKAALVVGRSEKRGSFRPFEIR